MNAREASTIDFKPGDQVEILRGKNKGKRGFVDRCEDDQVIVRSPVTGNSKSFPRSWLWLLPPVEVQPLQLVEGEPLQVLEALRDRLRSAGVLEDCWIENYQRGVWEGMFLPGSRVPQPSLLRTHPKTEDRIARLRALSTGVAATPISGTRLRPDTLKGPHPSLVPHVSNPRIRWARFGIYF